MPVLNVGITGSSGLVGAALTPRLCAEGHSVLALRRKPEGNGGDCSFSLPDTKLDVVVHLAGEPIAAGRWNDAQKARIRESRVGGTSSLCRAIVESSHPPRVLICASAVGFYGDRGDELLDESSRPGEGFLPEVVQAWEAASRAAVERGVRVVNLRFGMILSSNGGALAKMLTPFRCGLGGRIGTGRQYWSWVSIDDAVGAICRVMTDETTAGAVNAVAPLAVTNAEFTSSLARALGRPAMVPLPAWAAKLALGQMAEEVLLASARVVPRRLTESGYRFAHERLDEALQNILRA